jgi:hypothetical protein
MSGILDLNRPVRQAGFPVEIKISPAQPQLSGDQLYRSRSEGRLVAAFDPAELLQSFQERADMRLRCSGSLLGAANAPRAATRP